MQIFNRGGFSTGYLKGKLGKEMMYKYKPNHLGIYVGKVLNYNRNKGYVKFKAEKEVSLGDSIAINDSSCKTSELMIGNTNIKTAFPKLLLMRSKARNRKKNNEQKTTKKGDYS